MNGFCLPSVTCPNTIVARSLSMETPQIGPKHLVYPTGFEMGHDAAMAVDGVLLLLTKQYIITGLLLLVMQPPRPF